MGKVDQIRALREARYARWVHQHNDSPHRLTVTEPKAKRGRGRPAIPIPDGIPKVKLRGRGQPVSVEMLNTLTKNQPWLVLGMSRMTWYRRVKEGRL